MKKIWQWLKEKWRRLRWRTRLQRGSLGQWLMDRWAASARDIDIDVLWPEIKRQCVDLQQARMAMTFHAHIDWAWKRLDENEMYRRIAQLK